MSLCEFEMQRWFEADLEDKPIRFISLYHNFTKVAAVIPEAAPARR
jgi:hypothetical protein